MFCHTPIHDMAAEVALCPKKGVGIDYSNSFHTNWDMAMSLIQ
jgi:hypothetical protein